MVLSKRERIILIVAIAVVGLLVANLFVIDPVSRRLQRIESRRLALEAEFNEAQSLFERQRLLEPRWKTMLSAGLRSDAEAESRVARALGEWSADAGLTLSSVKPERVASDKGLKEMTFVVAGKGPLDAVAWFLYEVETAVLPIKVKNMQLGSSAESGDTMSLQLRLSALYLGVEPKPSEQQQKQTEPVEAYDEEIL
jgi:Tfp pilus assembly protein PilO